MKAPETIKIDDVEYVRKDSSSQAFDEKGRQYVIVRCDRSSPFAGWLEAQEGREVTLLNARRIYYWAGAATLSQLAVDGVSKPESCKFPCEVAEVKLLDAIEILNATEKARKSIGSVPVWKA